MSKRFDAFGVDFINQKTQDYMNWLSVSLSSWKDLLGDFMDLNSCALNGTVASYDDLESLMVNTMNHTCYSKAVLDQDSIQWQNIDVPRSLMVP